MRGRDVNKRFCRRRARHVGNVPHGHGPTVVCARSPGDLELDRVFRRDFRAPCAHVVQWPLAASHRHGPDTPSVRSRKRPCPFGCGHGPRYGRCRKTPTTGPLHYHGRRCPRTVAPAPGCPAEADCREALVLLDGALGVAGRLPTLCRYHARREALCAASDAPGNTRGLQRRPLLPVRFARQLLGLLAAGRPAGRHVGAALVASAGLLGQHGASSAG